MAGPYDVLGVKFEDSDEAIRARYLELVRQYPPERNAERFSQIRAAYEKVRSLQLRIEHRLYAAGREDTADDVIREVFAQMPRQRYALTKLVDAHRKAAR